MLLLPADSAGQPDAVVRTLGAEGAVAVSIEGLDTRAVPGTDANGGSGGVLITLYQGGAADAAVSRRGGGGLGLSSNDKEEDVLVSDVVDIVVRPLPCHVAGTSCQVACTSCHVTLNAHP